MEQLADPPRGRPPNDFHVPLRQQSARVADARAETRAGDQLGQFEACGWFTDDSRLVRRMVLLGEGPLVVEDKLLPGPQADGSKHRAAVAPARTVAARRHVVRRPRAPAPAGLVRPVPGQTVGSRPVRLWSGVEPYTVFTRQKLTGGQAARFVTVLVPHRPEADPATLATGIQLRGSTSSRLEVHLPLPSGAVDLGLDDRDGSWAVRRPQAATR